MTTVVKKTNRWAAGVVALAALLGTAPTGAEEPSDRSRPTTAALGERSDLGAQEQRMLRLAKLYAARCESAMEKWLADGETTEAKLFSFLYYPIANTDPVKFSTDWDKLADRDIRPISDDILGKAQEMVFAVMVDKHGYLPAHNTRYSQPPTGNFAVDLVNNRTKRIFADKTGLAAARNTEPFLIQHYSRDTGEQMADLSVPIYIQGKKWGAVRLGYRSVSGI